MEILDSKILGNSLAIWGIALGVALAFLLAASILRWLLGRQLKRLSDASDTLLWHALLAVVRAPQLLFLLVIALFFGSIALDLNDKARDLINLAAAVALLLQAGIWASAALRAGLSEYREQNREEDPASVTTLSIIAFVSGRYAESRVSRGGTIAVMPPRNGYRVPGRIDSRRAQIRKKRTHRPTSPAPMRPCLSFACDRIPAARGGAPRASNTTRRSASPFA